MSYPKAIHDLIDALTSIGPHITVNAEGNIDGSYWHIDVYGIQPHRSVVIQIQEVHRAAGVRYFSSYGLSLIEGPNDVDGAYTNASDCRFGHLPTLVKYVGALLG